MFSVATYDARNVDILLNFIPVDAFASGSFVTLKYQADKNKGVSGAKGDMTVVKINNGLGNVTFRLKQNSQMHASLILQMNIDDSIANGVPLFPFYASQNGVPLAEGLYKIEKAPDRGFPGSDTGNDEPICEWTLVITNFRLLS